MNALIIGHSRFVKKRVLASFSASPSIRAIDVASRRADISDFAGYSKVVQVFADYELALCRAEPGIAYISLPNSMHSYWTNRALEHGWHVIVDKPLCLDEAAAELLVAQAKAKDRCLAESNIWAYHPVVTRMHELFREAGDRPKRVMASFVFPQLPAGDFRYQAELGGGAIADLGPYASTSWLEWFEELPSYLNCRITERSPNGVDTGFSVLAGSDAYGTLVGQFGFNGEYSNKITVAGERLRIEVDRIFTLTPTLSPIVSVRQGDKQTEITVAPADSLELFLQSFLEAIVQRDLQRFIPGILQRAHLQHLLSEDVSIASVPTSKLSLKIPCQQPISVWEYAEEYEAERTEILGIVDGVFRSGRLILGPNVEKFEEEFASYCGVEYGVGVDNATNGLFLALKALGIGAGDEVITVSNTAVPTVSAIVAAGAVPRFVDIERGTYLMNTSLLEQALTARTRCIMPVHLFGQCVDMEAVNAFARKHGLLVVEDCSQSHGAALHGRKAGAWSDVSVFSFYPTKPLGGYGDGGIVLTGSKQLMEKLRRLRFYGMDKSYYAEEDGYNSRLDEVQAAILRAKLKRLDWYIAQRQRLAGRYVARLAKTDLQLPVTVSGRDHAFYVYVCRHPRRDEIIKQLAARDIVVNISYPWPIHTMRAYARFGYKTGDLPETEAAATEIFSLPMFPYLSDARQDRVCDVIEEILNKKHVTAALTN